MFNHAPVIATTQFFSTATNGQVAENVGVGTSLFILIAYDPDGDTKGYALVDDYGLFSIDGNGIVSLTGALDYETTPSYVLRIAVSDGTDSVFEDITLTISDANEAPVFTQNHYFASVAENDATAAVETVSASIDAGETIAYSITAGGSGVFAIDENSGAITLKRALDFENEPTAYTLTINAYDGHYHTTAQVTVNVLDVNDNAPVLTALQTTASLVEQTAAAPIDTGITFMASDVDTNTSFSASDFAVSDAVTGAVDPRFAIVAAGNHWKLQLKAGATLDYENAEDQSIALMVKVNDGIYSDEAEVTITVTDINDVAPTLTAIQATASLAEQTAATPTDTGITFTASDVDTNTSFSATDFAVSDDRFQVVADGNDGTNWKLQLKAGKTLNYEDASDRSITLNVKVNDGIHDSADVVVTINVTDANDAPVFNEYALQWFATFAADGNVAEDIAIDTPIAVIWASDDDGNSLTYRLLDGAGAHLFKINESTGIISVKAALDYETATSHTLTIEASDGSATTTTDITIDVVNINDTAPVLDTNRTAVSLTEQTAATAVDTGIILTPSDPDGLHTFSDADFTLSGDARFEIVAAGNDWKLQLKTGATLDHENADDRTIALNVKVNDGGYDSNDVAITITVVDVNDNTPILTANQTTASLAEQTTTTAVDTGITFTVSDADASSTFSDASFEISGDERFEVVADGDDWKLQLKANKTLDYEDADDRSIVLNVKVNDDTHDSNEVAVTISVSDINDNTPTLTANQATASLAEQTATTAVDTGITFTASDVDTNTSFAFSDFTVSGDNRFEIIADGNNWKLQLKEGATLDHEDADDRVIALTIKVNDGDHDSNEVAVTINVSDVNDNAPVLVAFPSVVASLAEQTATTAVDTSIIFIVGDADATSTFSAADFTISDDRFQIVADGNDGYYWKLQLKTGATLNYEDANDRSIVLNVNVNDGVHDSNAAAVIVNVTDANDAPVFDAYAPQWFGTFANGNVAEDTATNTPIAVIWASDEDGDSITYRLVPNASSHLFKIDENVGIISVKGTLDFEATTSHTLKIEASDNKGGTTTTDVIINVTDVNEFAPVLTANQTTASLAEQDATAAAVDTGITFTARDADASSTFSAANFAVSGDNRFEVVADGDDWKLQLKEGMSLNYENANDRSIVLTIKVNDGDHDSNNVAVTINVVDVNEFAPVLTTNQTSASLAEQVATAAVDTGITFTARDADASSTFSATDFTISGDNRFQVVADGNGWKLQLKEGSSLDYEDADDRSIALKVKVNDGIHDSSDVAVTINVTDVNDNAPYFLFSETLNGGRLEEMTATKSTYTWHSFLFSDADAGTTFTSDSFTIFDADGNVDDRFEMVASISLENIWELNLKTGETLDYEDANDRSIVLTVQVNDGIHDSSGGASVVTINVTDVNDNAPVLVANRATVSLAEQVATAAVDTGITFTARDADATSTFSATDFSVSGDRRFEVVADGNNWKLQLKRGMSLNYENANDRSIALTVKVNDGVHDSDNIAVTINVTDANEFVPVLAVNQTTISLAEQEATAAVDTGITFTARDADASSTFSTSDFTISDADGNVDRRFEVVADGNNWNLQLKEGRSLDYEDADDRSIALKVKVNDGIHDSNDVAVNINVTDVNDNAPSIDGAYSSGGGRVEELTTTRSVWTGFGFRPSDRDAGTIFTRDSFTIIGADGNVDDRFEIHDRGYYWYLYLKTGETLDYDNPAHRFIDLTVMVSDGVNVSSPDVISNVTVKTVRRIDGNNNDNVIEGSSDFENIYGHGGADTIYAGAGDDSINGGNGNDTIYAGAGDDGVGGGSTGEDTLYGGAGDDRVGGGSDDDTIYGGAGDDDIFGHGDNDTLYGGAGDDFFRAGDDDDTVYGGAGVDNLYGDSGEDTFYGGTGVDFFLGEEGNDLFYLDIANAVEGNVNSDVATDFSRGGTNGIDRILIEVSRADKATIDRLITNQAKLNKLMELADIRWEKAHEYLSGQPGVAYTDDRNTEDTVIYDKRGTSRTDDDIILMVLTDFNDDLTFDIFQIVLEDIISGTSRSETLSGTGRNSTIHAGSNADTIYGDAGDDAIHGQNGHDTLYGGEDNDFLHGGNDNDTLHGEGGIDILYGNRGNDHFVLDIVNAGAADVDIVADFSLTGYFGRDYIRVDTPNGNETSFAALGLRVEQVANKVITGHETGVNNASTMDTVIYKIIGQADTARNGETDDVALMIIEDYTITDAHFATVVDVI